MTHNLPQLNLFESSFYIYNLGMSDSLSLIMSSPPNGSGQTETIDEAIENTAFTPLAHHESRTFRNVKDLPASWGATFLWTLTPDDREYST